MNEESMYNFLTKYNTIETQNKTMQVGRRVPITQLNYSRYAITFYVNGDLEMTDILEALNSFG